MTREDANVSDTGWAMPSMGGASTERQSHAPMSDGDFAARCATDLDPARSLDERIKAAIELCPEIPELAAKLNFLLHCSFLAATQVRERIAKIGSSMSRTHKAPLNSDLSRNNDRHSKVMVEEIRGLRNIFYLIASFVYRDPTSFQGTTLENLIAQLTHIARQTTSKKDMHGVIKVFGAIAAHKRFPASCIDSSIHVLCTVYGLANLKFEEELWACLSHLLYSQDREVVTDTLLNILLNLHDEAHSAIATSQIQGTLIVIRRIINERPFESLLVNRLQVVFEGLYNIFSKYPDIGVDVLRTVNASLFSENIVRSLPTCDWSLSHKKLDIMLASLVDSYVSSISSTEKYGAIVGRDILPSGLRESKILTNDDHVNEIRRAATRIEYCMSTYWQELSRPNVHLIAKLLVHAALLVPDTWVHIAHLMRDRALICPSEPHWRLYLPIALRMIVSDARKSEAIRSTVLTTCNEVFANPFSTVDVADLEKHFDHAYQILAHEQNVPASIVESLAHVIDVSGSNMGSQLFDSSLTVIRHVLDVSTQESEMCVRLSGQAMDSLNRAFVKCLIDSLPYAHKVYSLLILAIAPIRPPRMRLKAMDLLFRLRCDSKKSIQILTQLDNHGLSSVMDGRDTSLPPDLIQTSSNRTSLHEQPLRQGRSSMIDLTRAARSRSATRSSNMRETPLRQLPSLEIYGEWTKLLPEHQRGVAGKISYLRQTSKRESVNLDLGAWLDIVTDILDKGSEWETYSFALVHLPSQLSNRSLFECYVKQLQTLQNIVVTQLEKSSFRKPPQDVAISAGDIALCLFHVLTALIPYNGLFSRRELDNSVRTFSAGLNKWDRVGKCCIHALTLCCFEVPSVIDRHIFAIIQKMSQKITQADLAVDILEFLLCLVRLPDACQGATAKVPEDKSGSVGDDGSFFKTVFGICTKYIKTAREQRQEHAISVSERSSQRKNRQSGVAGTATSTLNTRTINDSTEDLSEYVYTLAYHVIIFWFLFIDVRQRSQHVGWIAKELSWQDRPGRDSSKLETLDEQSQVILDMMHRTAYSDLGETEPAAAFKDPNQISMKKTWLLGMSIVTLEVLPAINMGQFTKRQASGTTHALYSHTTSRLPDHHAKARPNESESFASELIDVYPNHMFLQLASTIAPVPIPLQPVVLPDDEFTQRVLRNFDRIDTVDGHKAGVIYVAEGQTSETEILANVKGSQAYDSFLSELGTSMRLQGAVFNSQGLDRESDFDGSHTYAWRDRVTEIVFHIPTMMPTDLENDPHCDGKKRHIGNDRVKIIFNESGQPFVFETFPSDFNEINIVITPEASIPIKAPDSTDLRVPTASDADAADEQKRSSMNQFGYYKVHILSSPNFPYVSPASNPKIVSAEALPCFVRQLALNASVFCQVWSEVLGQGNYISSWRARLQEIKRLREKYSNTHESANVSYPMPTNAPTYVEGDEWRGRVAMGGMTEMNQLLMSLDFTRWT